MSCDVRLDIDKPFRAKIVCYSCGEKIERDPQTQLIKDHKECHSLWNNKWIIKADIEIENEV